MKRVEGRELMSAADARRMNISITAPVALIDFYTEMARDRHIPRSRLICDLLQEYAEQNPPPLTTKER